MNITNDIITAYLNSLYQCDNEQLLELRAFAEEKRVPVILKDTESFLMSILKIKKPVNLLEIGTAIGYSACCFADGCGCHVTTLESDEEAYKIALSNVENLGFSEQIDVVYGDAREILQQMGYWLKKREEDPADEGDGETEGLFDAVFIDAAKSHYREFWDLAVPLCTDDALVICDNVLMKGMTASDQYDQKRRYKTSIRKMREFIKYINDLDYADTCILPVGDGISMSVIDRSKALAAMETAHQGKADDVMANDGVEHTMELE
ncbi:MAG: O-methyltransferase, partial [Bacillota bacterium]|nr:O-methyltransferase [Bacillota bacterium]